MQKIYLSQLLFKLLLIVSKLITLINSGIEMDQRYHGRGRLSFMALTLFYQTIIELLMAAIMIGKRLLETLFGDQALTNMKYR